MTEVPVVLCDEWSEAQVKALGSTVIKATDTCLNCDAVASPGDDQIGDNAAPLVLAERAKPTRLALDHITLDSRLQSRQLRTGVVKGYLAVLRRGEELPPVVVVHDGNDIYYLIDGYHRVAATRQLLGIEDISVEIIAGTYADALWLSWRANRNHGLRRTQKETCRAIQAAITHPRWSRESDRAIAQHIGCDHKTVGAMRRKCTAGEFPTENVTQGLRPPSGPSKSKILEACRVLAKVQPEQARHFSREELTAVKTGYESLHRLLLGASTLRLEKPNDAENTSEKGVNISNQNN
jgi:hypothetical protein